MNDLLDRRILEYKVLRREKYYHNYAEAKYRDTFVLASELTFNNVSLITMKNDQQLLTINNEMIPNLEHSLNSVYIVCHSRDIQLRQQISYYRQDRNYVDNDNKAPLYHSYILLCMFCDFLESVILFCHSDIGKILITQRAANAKN